MKRSKSSAIAGWLLPARPESWIVRSALGVASAISTASLAPAQSFSGLGFLPGTGESSASGVSGTGQVVVGTSFGIAFRWTSDGGMTSLGALSGGDMDVTRRVAAPMAP
jgi:hypothetical protein